MWLQRRLYRPGRVSWYDVLATLVYSLHFVATPVLAALLWLRSRGRWLWYARRLVVLAVAGLATCGLFPEAPPWLAARDGWSDPIARLSARGWIRLRVGNLDRLLAKAQSAGSNPVAAMPSLHTAFATLVAITVICAVRSRWCYLAAVYPLAMGRILFYTGEHYVLDIVAGSGLRRRGAPAGQSLGSGRAAQAS